MDPERIVAAGHSFGGSLTLLLAAADTTVHAAIVFSGSARGQTESPELRARLHDAARQIRAPVLFLHAANDYSTSPGTALAADMARLGKSHGLKIYPAVGTTPSEGHNFLYRDIRIWEPEVFAFLDAHLRG